MKGLSIEEKAEAYDKALERALKLRVQNPFDTVSQMMEHVFPELKDSEDEKIRKAILVGLIDCRDAPDMGWTNFGGVSIDKCIAWLEKQSEKEEPHAYKTKVIEQEFHEGDFIKHNKANVVYKVISVNSGSYHVENIETGNRSELLNAEPNFHLWTIKDAKDGDVLASELCDSIILFKGIKDSNIDFYCDYDFSEIDVPGDRFAVNDVQHYGSVEDSKDIHPATKEQRGLLFQKIKEAGYEWDYKKKELREIDDEIEIPFGAKDSELQEATYYIPKGFHAEIDNDKVVIKKGEKPAWREEDEQIILSIEQVMNCASLLNIVPERINKVRTWLKSLKPRICNII